jgi:hypothetical protein
VRVSTGVFVTESGSNYRICDEAGGCSLWTTCESTSWLRNPTTSWEWYVTTLYYHATKLNMTNYSTQSPNGCNSQVLLPSLGASGGQTYYDCLSYLLRTPFFTGNIYLQSPTSTGTFTKSTTASISASTSLPTTSPVSSPSKSVPLGPIIGGVIGGIVAICITVIVGLVIVKRNNKGHTTHPTNDTPSQYKGELNASSNEPGVTAGPGLIRIELPG